MFVSVEGNYYACERVLHCHETTIGNINEGIKLEKIYKMLDEWVETNKSDCINCWCLPICHVGCFASVAENGRVTKEAKDRACDAHRQLSHQLLIDYCQILEKNPEAFKYTKNLEFY